MNEDNNNNYGGGMNSHDDRFNYGDKYSYGGNNIPPYYNSNRQPMMQPPVRKKTGLAVGAFCAALANFLAFRSILSFICVPIAMIMAIVSLKKHYDAKGLSIAAIIISLLSTVVFAVYVVIGIKLYPEIEYFSENKKAIITEYEKTGTAPEHYDKFRGNEYNFIWSNLGVDDFDDFFDMLMSFYTEKTVKSSSSTSPKDKDEKTTAPEDTTKNKDINHDGEDLVILS